MLWISIWMLLIKSILCTTLFRWKSDTSCDLDMPSVFLIFWVDRSMPLQLCIDLLIHVRIHNIGLLPMALNRNSTCSYMVLDITSLPNSLNFCVDCRSTLFWSDFLVARVINHSWFERFFWRFFERFLRACLFNGKFVADHPVRKLFFSVKLRLENVPSDRGAETYSDSLSNVTLI